MTVSPTGSTIADMTAITRRTAPIQVRDSARVAGGREIVALLLLNLALIVGLWVRHGGLDRLATPADVVTGIGQLTALVGTAFALLQLLLMSRSPWLDRAFGRDRLTQAHRWVGFATVWLLIGHGVFTTIGFAMAEGVSPIAEAWTLITTWEFVLMATVGLALFIAVAVTSVRLARRRLSYETWHGVHLYAYLAIALAFAHQLVVGSDFVDDPIARLYWIGLYLATIGPLLAFRFWVPIVRNLRHRFRVASVIEEAPGVVSVYITGRDLDRLPVRAGQYLIIRFLTDGWWRAHPYSLSAQPNGRWLRVTAKALGDDSARLDRLAVGTRVFIEGPYGNLTADRRTAWSSLLIAGGIGITPLRALLEELSAHGPVALLYRARRVEDIVFRDELERISTRSGVDVHYVEGRREAGDRPVVPDAEAILQLVPDVADREVYLCGPVGMMDRAAGAVRSLGVPAARIHQERFGD